MAAEDGRVIVGYAYGFTFGPDEWWEDADGRPSETFHTPKFAGME